MSHRFHTKKNLNKLKNILLDNNYPPYILQKILFIEPKINNINSINKTE